MSRSSTVAGMPRAARQVPMGMRGRAATTTSTTETIAMTHRQGSATSFESDSASAAAAVSTDHPTLPRLHRTVGSPCTWSRTRRIGGTIIAAAGTSRPITPRNTQCQLSASATSPGERRARRSRG